MKYARKAICFVLILLLTPFCAQALSNTRVRAVPLEAPSKDDKLYVYAMSFFENNEEIIRIAAEKMFESGLDKIEMRYHRSDETEEGKYIVHDETWVYYEVGTEKTELFDSEYLDLANCTGDFRIMSMRLCEDVIAVDFEDAHDSVDFLRTYRFGYYYLPKSHDEIVSVDEILSEAMPEEWTVRLQVEDEYQLVPLTEDFIYYKWHG